MKKISYLKIAIFLIISIGFSVAAAQDKDRIRVVITPTPTPTIPPAPSASPTPFKTPTQTLSDLQSKIRLSLGRWELRRGTVGVKISSLETGKVVYEENAEKYLMPASNMKSFTVATALEKLSPDFRFVTSVYAVAQADASGTLKGDLTIYGRGDVSVSTAFSGGDYYKSLDALADKIAQSGVRRIEGNLIADESYFSGNAIPLSWEWDDLQWYYGAEVSALPINDNALDLTIKPGSVGAPCFVQLQPASAVMRIVNRCVTTASSVRRDLTVKKDLDQNVLEVSGTLPLGDRGFSNYLTVSRPAEHFIQLLRQRLEKKGVVITGQTRVVSAKDKAGLSAASSVQPIEIARLESPPLSLIAAKTMKPSQNMYTETILWTLGEQAKNFAAADANAADKTPLSNPKATSSEKGVYVVQNFLKEVGVASDSVIQWDGSGLSRHNLVTAASLVQLYGYMAKRSKYNQAWLDSLTVGATDGTLKDRFRGTKAAGNVRGKTGTIDQVSALSGYVTTAAGEKLVFSIIINGVNQVGIRQAVIDEIVVHLANFNGRVNPDGSE